MLLLAALFVAAESSLSAASFDRIKGVGVDRENLSDDELAMRTEKLIEASEFWDLRVTDAQFTPGRILDEHTWQIIVKAANDHGIPDPFLLAAVGATESNGRADAVSPTGPKGWGQFALATTKEVGLKVVQSIQKIVTKTMVWKGRGKARRQVQVTRTKYVRGETVDDRLDLEKSINAVAIHLAQGFRTYGRWDFAIQQHHNGAGRVLRALSLYTGKKVTEKNAAEVIRTHHLSYPGLYFGNTPHFRAEVYKYLSSIPDYGSKYYFRVAEYEQLLKLAKSDPRAYQEKFARYRSEFKPDGVAPSRMWYYYTQGELRVWQFATLEDIRSASGVRLFPLPSEIGFKPRLKGTAAIGEKDLAHQTDYVQAEAPVIGGIAYIANELKLLQGKKFIPYEISSLVRSIEGQMLLRRDPNSKATAELPTHTMAKATDFPVAGMSADRIRDLQFILEEMDSLGLVSYSGEYQPSKKGKPVLVSYHLVPDPKAEGFFAKIFSTIHAAAVPTSPQ